MQLTSIVLGAVALPFLAAAAPAASSQAAAPQFVSKVVNNCAFPVFVQSVPNDGSAKGPIETLAGHGKGQLSQAQHGADGFSFIVSNTRTLANPLSFGWTQSNSLVYYDLGDEFGNPFLGFTNTLLPSDSACAKFECQPHDEACYSNGSHLHIENCKHTDLTLKLCA